MLECVLPAGKRIEYLNPTVPGLEHHILVLDGFLEMTIDGNLYGLRKGDCLRYQLYGPSVFETRKDQPAKYLVFIM